MTVSDARRPAGQTGASERRPITVLFADIAGSTAIAERLDPEDWTALIGEAFQRMNRTVERYGGTIARLMGDGVLAFFGAPTAHEDDPERAVRCGLDLVRAIEELDASKHLPEADTFKVRVGINTGPVVVGVVGTETASEYTAMGDTVNVAARMQASARPGNVLVTSATYRFISPLVEAVDVGQLELKGKSETVHAYEITGLKEGAVHTRGLAGVRSPMVGRDAQLDQLVKALIRSIIGVTETTDEAQVAQALDSFVNANSREDCTDTCAYLGHLLSLKLSPEMKARISQMEIETVKRYMAAVVQVVRAATAGGPTVIVCDDIHWSDTASADALVQVIHIVAGLPVLFILSSRPERASTGWRLITAARDAYGESLTEIRLDPLSMDDSRTLVGNLLSIESLPQETRNLILAKAEGNPFFVEEVIRMLIDRSAIVREDDRWVANEKAASVEIPDTLHGLLLARIDRLPAESRRTLRVASVIGRQFGVTILEKLLEPKAL